MLRIQLLFSKIALFVRIKLLCSYIRRLPLNRANGVELTAINPSAYNITSYKVKHIHRQWLRL